MNDPSTNNFYAVVKQVNKFNGKRAKDFLEWQAKLCPALSLYKRPIFDVLQGVQWPSSENADGTADHATWGIANQKR